MTSSEEAFNVLTSLDLFKKCLRKDGTTIDLKDFVSAYKSLVKLFDQLGAVFSFVKSDLVDKFQNIDRLQSNDKTNNYETIQSMINYEKKNRDIYMQNHNGTLSVLRLHRGLDFIINFLENLHKNRENSKKTPELAASAYEKTLAFRHKWAVRKLCKTGFYMLPHKHDLIKTFSQGIEKESDPERLFNDFLDTLHNIFDTIYKLYDANKFLELVVQ